MRRIPERARCEVDVHDDIGPPIEHTQLTRREDNQWWVTLTGIFREEQANMGSIRPAFTDRANRYLKTNGSRKRAQ